jgi:hypothetical protein
MISFPAGEVAGATRVVAGLLDSGIGRPRAASAEIAKNREKNFTFLAAPLRAFTAEPGFAISMPLLDRIDPPATPISGACGRGGVDGPSGPVAGRPSVRRRLSAAPKTMHRDSNGRRRCIATRQQGALSVATHFDSHRPGVTMHLNRPTRAVLAATVVMLPFAPARTVHGPAPRAPKAPICAPDNGGIILPKGFCAVVVADSLPAPRHMVVMPNGDLYVSSMRTGMFGLRDTNGDGRANVVQDWGGTFHSSEVAVRDGYLYSDATTAILRFPIKSGSLTASTAPSISTSGRARIAVRRRTAHWRSPASTRAPSATRAPASGHSVPTASTRPPPTACTTAPASATPSAWRSTPPTRRST